MGKNGEPECIDEEIPFEVPNNWIILRLKSLGISTSGKTPESKEIMKEGKYPYFKVGDMNTIGNETFLQKTENYLSEEYKGKKFDAQSIVYPKNGGALFTNKKRILKYESVVDLNTGVFKPYSCLYLKYIFYLFNTIDFKKYYKGTAVPTLDKKRMDNLIFGLPPLNEQKRIVKKIDELIPYIENYDVLEEKLDKLNSEFPNKLKESILQEAIQGKLVPQDPNDEPASVLLERIQKEKEQLIKEKKIKRNNKESFIYKENNHFYEKIGKNGEPKCIDEKLPFKIPENWEWVKLNTVVKLLGDGIHGTPKYDGNGDYYFINGNNLNNGKIVFKDNTKKINYEEYLKHKRKLTENTVLVSINGTIGNVAFYNDEKIILGKSACYFNLFEDIYKYYIKILIESEYFIKYALKSATGTTIKNVSLKAMKNWLIPIPPINEQKEIVNKLEELSDILNI
ncbi:restriction endonuclease subunit S [uncultured Methanobrevibacter sp.]|uniref:restriction endonuclease subunit S n=1 Tax=uncultured Methanobrevibacter sp. TaxID=253161 RepID=UPI003183A343